MEDFEYVDYESEYQNYSYENGTNEHFVIHMHNSWREILHMIGLVVNGIICLLGVFGNGAVIWIAGLKMKKTVNITWYLSLAISDFVFCMFLPFNIAYVATYDWIFGLFMCKFTSFIMFLNMFSSIFLLVIISIDRCVSVVFPVWAQNHRTVKKALIVVIFAWTVAIALSVPSAVFREVKPKGGKTECYNNFKVRYEHVCTVLSRFICGFVAPFVIIIFCYTIIMCKLRSNIMTKSSKPFKVMSALIATFFICWMPYHIFMLLELNYAQYSFEVIHSGLILGTSLAFASSFLNPILYVFMGNDFKHKFKYSVLSKIENAISEEGRTISRYFSRSSSVERTASTHI